MTKCSSGFLKLLVQSSQVVVSMVFLGYIDVLVFPPPTRSDAEYILCCLMLP